MQTNVPVKVHPSLKSKIKKNQITFTFTEINIKLILEMKILIHPTKGAHIVCPGGPPYLLALATGATPEIVRLRRTARRENPPT